MSAPLGAKNSTVRLLRRYLQSRDARDSDGVFVAEGLKLLHDGLAAGHKPEAVFVAADANFDSNDIDVQVVEPGVIDRIASTVTPQDVLALFKQCDVDLGQANAPAMVLCDVRDPGNAGTILRSCEAAGMGSVIFAGTSVDLYSPKVVRSSAGAIFYADVVRNVDAVQVIEMGWHNIGTAMNGNVAYDHTDLTADVALYLGNEAHGLDEQSLASMDSVVSIPIAGRSESLNVSMAASVLSFEYARQKRSAGSRPPL